MQYKQYSTQCGTWVVVLYKLSKNKVQMSFTVESTVEWLKTNLLGAVALRCFLVADATWLWQMGHIGYWVQCYIHVSLNCFWFRWSNILTHSIRYSLCYGLCGSCLRRSSRFMHIERVGMKKHRSTSANWNEYRTKCNSSSRVRFEKLQCNDTKFVKVLMNKLCINV